MPEISGAAPTSGRGESDASPPHPRQPWTFWGTAFWGAAELGVGFAAQFAIFSALMTLWSRPHPPTAEIERLASSGVTISLVTIGAAPLCLAIVALAVRLARWPLLDYLALTRPRGRDVLLGLAVVMGCLVAADTVTYLSGRSLVTPFMVDAYRSARDAGLLWLLFAALVIAAPLTEEILFRGFVFRGWSSSRLGVAGTIVLTSAIWASMHVQYEVFFIVQIFLLGLALGWLRWRSGSTTVPLILHALVNFSALTQTAIITEWFPA